MRDFSKQRSSKQQKGRFALGVAGLLVLGVVTFVALRATWGMYGKFTAAAADDSNAHKELVDLTAQKAQVGASVSTLSSDRGVEAQLREEYGVAKPGEAEIQVVRDQAATSTEPVATPNLVIKIWQALFGWL